MRGRRRGTFDLGVVLRVVGLRGWYRVVSGGEFWREMSRQEVVWDSVEVEVRERGETVRFELNLWRRKGWGKAV